MTEAGRMITLQGIVVFVVAMTFLVCADAAAGILSGRIIKEGGSSLAKAKIVIEGKEIVTNEFGGYEVDLRDGERELRVVIDNAPYTSEKILIVSPRTSQNWRMNSTQKRLIKIR
jgi:hypothetical protein